MQWEILATVIVKKLKFTIQMAKEIVAKYNECSKEGEYFQCHTDITIPYEELDSICAITLGGDEILLIKDGKFVLSGTETLNEPLTEIG